MTSEDTSQRTTEEKREKTALAVALAEKARVGTDALVAIRRVDLQTSWKIWRADGIADGAGSLNKRHAEGTGGDIAADIDGLGRLAVVARLHVLIEGRQIDVVAGVRVVEFEDDGGVDRLAVGVALDEVLRALLDREALVVEEARAGDLVAVVLAAVRVHEDEEVLCCQQVAH